MKYYDTIDVRLCTYINEDQSYGGSYNYASLFLNGEQVKGTFDELNFVLSLSFEKKKNFFIMSCGCGQPECAGIWDGTTVRRRRNSIEWRDIDCGLPKRFYNFNITQYTDTIAKTIGIMKEIGAANALLAPDKRPYNSWESAEEVEPSIARTIAWRKRWNP